MGNILQNARLDPMGQCEGKTGTSSSIFELVNGYIYSVLQDMINYNMVK